MLSNIMLNFNMFLTLMIDAHDEVEEAVISQRSTLNCPTISQVESELNMLHDGKFYLHPYIFPLSLFMCFINTFFYHQI